MSEEYDNLRLELETTKRELEMRLEREHLTEVAEEFTATISTREKRNTLLHHIHDDLQDVNRALRKMEIGIFGICEQTGVTIPMKQMKILPTARTIYDFASKDYS